MRFLSVCSGIEAASVAWPGWEAVGFSEIEKFPSAVLAHHYPSVPNLGDMTKYKEWKIGAIDLLVGGTPCQSFSVAGLRKGLEDHRGNLMLVFCGILDWFKPRWFVWENVPGVLSSNGGRDFGAFLGAVAELGYGWAYRVLDAQYFGVAQRRRRVFVVGCLGNWESAAKVLFERESLSGNPAPRRETRKVAPTIPSRSSAGGGLGTDFDCDGGLIQDVAASHVSGLITTGAAHSNRDTMVAHAFDARQSGVTQYGDKSGPLDTDGHSVGVAIGTDCYKGQITGDVAATMGTPGSSVNASGPTVMQPVAFAQNQRDEVRVINVAGALAAEPGMKQQTYLATQGVAFQQIADCLTSAYGTKWNGNASADNGSLFAAHGTAVAPSLTASNDPSQSPQSSEVTQQVNAVYASSMQVRRLTPVECERLQGFPDNYTNIPWRGKPESPDGPRYKALGNSMAVPVMKWIGERIHMVQQ